MRRAPNRRGQALVEFTLVTIPLIFILISTFEMARGMWDYQTLCFSVRAGLRYAAAHGQGCSQNGNTCTLTVSDVAHAIAGAAVGLPPGNFNAVLSSTTAASVSCTPVSSCYGNVTVWPPAADSAPGKDIAVSGTYVFRSAISMYWPGTSPLAFGSFTLSAWSRQQVLF